jgi:hypothetical protein
VAAVKILHRYVKPHKFVRFDKSVRYEPVILGFISGYEFAALLAHHPRLPTITTVVKGCHPLIRRCLAVAAGVYLWHHFDDEDAAGWFFDLFEVKR